MKFTVVTLFPRMVQSAFEEGVTGQALAQGRFELQTINPREFVQDVHHTVDDRPFGGGDGMVMLFEPLQKAIAKAVGSLSITPNSRETVLSKSFDPKKTTVVYLSPHGKVFDQQKARELAGQEHVVLISGRYAGVDQRLIAEMVDEEISLGDFILSGGEIAAVAVMDSVVRLLPGVLGNEASSKEESFGGRNSWLEAPQFTRPREIEGRKVPEVLLSGNHRAIEQWRESASLLVTRFRRPDLLRQSPPSEAQWEKAEELWKTLNSTDKKLLGLPEDVRTIR